MALSLILLKLNASKKNYDVIFVINDAMGVCPGPILRPKEDEIRLHLQGLFLQSYHEYDIILEVQVTITQ